MHPKLCSLPYPSATFSNDITVTGGLASLMTSLDPAVCQRPLRSAGCCRELEHELTRTAAKLEQAASQPAPAKSADLQSQGSGASAEAHRLAAELDRARVRLPLSWGLKGIPAHSSAAFLFVGLALLYVWLAALSLRLEECFRGG